MIKDIRKDKIKQNACGQSSSAEPGREMRDLGCVRWNRQKIKHAINNACVVRGSHHRQFCLYNTYFAVRLALREIEEIKGVLTREGR